MYQAAAFQSKCYCLNLISWSQCCFLSARDQLVYSYSIPYKWANTGYLGKKTSLNKLIK